MADFSAVLDGFKYPEGTVNFFETPEAFGTKDLKLGDAELQAHIKGLVNGDYLLANQSFTGLTEVEPTAQFIEFDPFGQTRRHSAHEVQFGQLILRSMADREKVANVAVKPFDIAKSALHEFSVMTHINRAAKINDSPASFEPVGFQRSNEGNWVNLISIYDPTVISYDNLFWDEERVPSNAEIDKAMVETGRALALLHGQGLIHGDASIKNFAVDNRGIRFIDLEETEPFPMKGGQVDIEAVRLKIEDDIRTFVSSLNTKIEGEPRDYTRVVEEVFARTYALEVGRVDSRVPLRAQLSPGDIRALVQDAQEHFPI